MQSLKMVPLRFWSPLSASSIKRHFSKVQLVMLELRLVELKKDSDILRFFSSLWSKAFEGKLTPVIEWLLFVRSANSSISAPQFSRM